MVVEKDIESVEERDFVNPEQLIQGIKYCDKYECGIRSFCLDGTLRCSSRFFSSDFSYCTERE